MFQRWKRFRRRFADAREGAVAVQFSLIVLPLAVLSLGLIDVNRASMSKRSLQDALDAAALVVARSDAATDSQADLIGQAALAAQLTASREGRLIKASFSLGGTGGSTVIATASVSVDPVVADLWLRGDMKVGAHSEVTRSSTNLEVSLVLDVTGSMGGSRIGDLKDAAGDLVDLVVQDVQAPFYSKVAVVPYSMGVNLGSRADEARGEVRGGAAISGASWADGSAKAISGASRSNPVTITANGHGFSNGDSVWIDGIKGMTELNGRRYIVTNRKTNSFQLAGVDSRYYGKYKSASNDYATRCQTRDCEVVVTAASHGFKNNDEVYITGVNGMSDLNNRTWTVKDSSTSQLTLDGSVGPDYSRYQSGGALDCLAMGCRFFRFDNMYGADVVREVSDCVTERTGRDAFTDASPGRSPVGWNYPSSSNPCLSNPVVGLSANRSMLKGAIGSLDAEGSTAGQIGLAWGWYAVSPNFGEIFGGASQPVPYGTKDLLKVVVLMTDGEFNTAYCDGVIARDSGTGSGSNSDKINCNATEGDGYSQASDLCDGMKDEGITIYTVGFDISSSRDVTDLLRSCASSSQHFYQPANGRDLKEAFKAIGKDISNLRISK